MDLLWKRNVNECLVSLALPGTAQYQEIEIEDIATLQHNIIIQTSESACKVCSYNTI